MVEISGSHGGRRDDLDAVRGIQGWRDENLEGAVGWTTHLNLQGWFVSQSMTLLPKCNDCAISIIVRVIRRCIFRNFQG